MGIDALNPINQHNISTLVYDYIKKAIMSGQLKCGERISEQTIAQQLCVSRTPVREGLKMLDEYGLIRLKARSYAEVIALSDKEIRDLIALRADLEGFSIELFTQSSRIHPEIIAAVRTLSDDCRNALSGENVSAIFEKDSSFHLEIARRTENSFLFDELERLDAKIQLFRISQCIEKKAIMESVAMHDIILDAVAAGNAARARRLMEQHCRAHSV